MHTTGHIKADRTRQIAALSRRHGEPIRPLLPSHGDQVVSESGALQLLDETQTCLKLGGFSRSWLRARMARGEFVQPVYIGRSLRFRECDIDRWIELQVEQTSKV